MSLPRDPPDLKTPVEDGKMIGHKMRGVPCVKMRPFPPAKAKACRMYGHLTPEGAVRFSLTTTGTRGRQARPAHEAALQWGSG